MYLKHFHLKVKPFQITSDPKFLWMSEKHKEALATLRYGILDNRGFLLLTGEVGTGKTILINRLVSMIEIDTVVATLPDPDLESMDFYNMLADGLKMNRTFDSKGSFLIYLRDYLHKSYAEGKKVLLIIDESQRLNHRLMEDIRVLSNIELHDRKLINIFFVGQQEFNSTLRAPQNRALAQRINVRYHIEPLNRAETGAYIDHRIKVAGSEKRIFRTKALDEIYLFSNGIPRLINIICDHALLTGYTGGFKNIDEEIIKECAKELHIPGSIQQPVAKNELDTNLSSNLNASQGAIQLEGNRHKELERERLVSESTAISNSSNTGRSVIWKLTYAAMIFFLLAIVVFAIDRFSGNDRPRWDAEDLTPQAYKTSLEKEKGLLTNRLLETDGESGQAEKSAEGSESELNKGPGITWGQIHTEEKVKTEIIQPAQPKEMAHQNKVMAPVVPAEEKAQTSEFLLKKEKFIINFEINSNEIEGQSYAVLDNIAEYMVKHSDEIIHLRGYTDNSGAIGYNESVSRFRASAVKSYLIGKGVIADNIIVFAMGSVDPIASNESFEGRRKNRRVEIEFPQKHGA
jgi:general secretion pathway protein A